MKKTTTYTQLYLSNTLPFINHVVVGYHHSYRGVISRADESWWLLYTTQLVWLCIYDASQICADTSYAKTTALSLIKEASVHCYLQHLKFFWASSQLYVNNITVVIIYKMEEKRVMGKEVVNERTSLYQLKLRNGNHIPYLFLCKIYHIYLQQEGSIIKSGLWTENCW